MAANEKVLLVILEQHFVKKGNDVFTDVQCDESFWDRYLTVFDRLVVCARMREANSEDDTGHMLHSSRPEISFVGMPDFVGAAGPIKNFRAINSALKRCFKQSDAAIFRIPSPISMVAYPIVRKSGLPWACEMMMNPRTAYSKDSMDHPLQPAIQTFITKQTKRACMEANGVSYVTDHVLQQEYPCAALTKNNDMHFTASYSTIDLDSSRYSCIDWGSSKPTQIVLAHTGKMSDDRKGHAIFIETVALLKLRGLDVRGILIGDGPKRPEFERLACNRGVREELEFAGWASGFDEVQRILQRAHFFVMPTKSEGLPRAVIEAMASGLICIGNNVDGIPELLGPECLSSNNNPVEYAGMITRISSDWERALQIRAVQFESSKKYERNRLQAKRTSFYTRLKEASCGSIA